MYKNINIYLMYSLINSNICLTDDTIKLSINHLMRNFYEEFNPKIYNNLEHRNLYLYMLFMFDKSTI